MSEDPPEPLRTDPQWETDFGPPAGRVRRLVYAAICVASVLGFFAVVLTSYGTTKTEPAKIDTDIPIWVFFIPFTIMLLVVAIYGERFALWIQKKAGWSNEDDED